MKTRQSFSLFGILGFPLAHTLSPRMQEAAFEHLGIKAFYLVLEMRPSDFKFVMRRLRHFLIDGFNVTVPYKSAVIPYLDRVTEEARKIGAVNTVCRQGKRWVGANTDAEGFYRSLVHDGGFHPRRKDAVVFGAGGSARAVIYALAGHGARHILIANRHPARAEKIARDFRKVFKLCRFTAIKLTDPAIRKAVEQAPLIINATSAGLKPSDTPVFKASWIPPAKKGGRKLFYDLIYSPARTRFLKAAAGRGHRILNGVGMLVHQGALAQELWLKRPAPVAVMRRALAAALKEKDSRGKKNA